MTEATDRKADLALFAGLQVLDAATTLTGFHFGAAELNPLIGHFLHLGSLAGLIAAKLVAVPLALACYRWRPHGLRTLNLFYAALFLWNFAVIVLEVTR